MKDETVIKMIGAAVILAFSALIIPGMFIPDDQTFPVNLEARSEDFQILEGESACDSFGRAIHRSMMVYEIKGNIVICGPYSKERRGNPLLPDPHRRSRKIVKMRV